MKQGYGNALLLLTSFIWGTGFIGCQITLDEGMSPFTMITGRFLVAAVILHLVFYKKWRAMTKEVIGAGSFIGLWLFVGFVFQTYGLQYSSPSVNAFVTATYVVMIPFFYWAYFKKRPDLYGFIGAAMAVLGVSLISVTDKLSFNMGAFLTLVSALCYTFQVSATDIYTKKYDPIALTMVIIDFTFVASLACTLVMALAQGGFPAVTGKGLAAVVYLGVVCSAVAFLAQSVGQKYTTAAKAGILFSTEAVFATILSVVIYKESLSLKMLAGCGLIFSAILVSETKLNFSFLKNAKKLNMEGE